MSGDRGNELAIFREALERIAAPLWPGDWSWGQRANEMQEVAREALSRVSRSEPAPPNDDQGANSANYAKIREALEVARQRHAALGLVISEGTGYGPSVGVAMAHHEGQAEILAIFEAAINGDWPEPEPLPKRLYGPEARDSRERAILVETQRDRIRTVPDRWHRQYGSGYYADKADKQEIGRKLSALDLETASPAEIKEIIGNWSWIAQSCGVCGRDDLERWVRLGDEPDYDSVTVYACTDCLRAALADAEGSASPAAVCAECDGAGGTVCADCGHVDPLLRGTSA